RQFLVPGSFRDFSTIEALGLRVFAIHHGYLGRRQGMRLCNGTVVGVACDGRQRGQGSDS
ncbi:MAG: hypothetical protein WBP63_05505, partial [Silvibacterium sp.]